jgi:hypothetical protein
MANTERVKAVVEHMEDVLSKQPEKVINKLSLDMGSWFEETKDAQGNVCGTSMCLAGWSAHYDGRKMFNYESDETWNGVGVKDDDGETVDIEKWAADFFEFENAESDIFYETHIVDIDHLKASINYHLEEEVFKEVKDYDEFEELY